MTGHGKPGARLHAAAPPPGAGLAALTRVLPCVVCFSPADPLVQDSVNAGIFVLLGATTIVLAGFAVFIISIVRRSSADETRAGFLTSRRKPQPMSSP